jgi:hypothetical protein
MMWETLYDYLDTQCTTITDLLPATGKKAAPRHVHKLRTSIKRARACLMLIKQFSGRQFKGKRYARLLKILKQAAGETAPILYVNFSQGWLRLLLMQNALR